MNTGGPSKLFLNLFAESERISFLIGRERNKRDLANLHTQRAHIGEQLVAISKEEGRRCSPNPEEWKGIVQAAEILWLSGLPKRVGLRTMAEVVTCALTAWQLGRLPGHALSVRDDLLGLALAQKRLREMETEQPSHQKRNPTMNAHKAIQTKFDCDPADAETIANLLKQADDAGVRGAFGPPAKIEKHPEFEDEAGLDLDTLETALLLDEGVLLQTFRDRYKKAYAARPAAG